MPNEFCELKYCHCSFTGCPWKAGKGMGKLVLMNFIHIYIVSHLSDTMVGKGILGQSETAI